MPPTRTANAQCTNKEFTHDTRQAAIIHREMLIEKGAARGSIGVYECRHCEKFHVGHRSRNTNEVRRKKRRR
jgi:hypothetical protein